tara:strand:+ start:474 stop:635 length:162 start_codon:yes stop_codon:yes gene_type:complete
MMTEDSAAVSQHTRQRNEAKAERPLLHSELIFFSFSFHFLRNSPGIGLAGAHF